MKLNESDDSRESRGSETRSERRPTLLTFFFILLLTISSAELEIGDFDFVWILDLDSDFVGLAL